MAEFNSPQLFHHVSRNYNGSIRTPHDIDNGYHGSCPHWIPRSGVGKFHWESSPRCCDLCQYQRRNDARNGLNWNQRNSAPSPPSVNAPRIVEWNGDNMPKYGFHQKTSVESGERPSKPCFDQSEAVVDKEENKINLTNGGEIKTSTEEEINKKIGNVGKHVDRLRYRKPKRFNTEDQIKAYTMNGVEYIHLHGQNVGFVRRKGARNYFKDLVTTGGEDIQELGNILTETKLRDACYSAGLHHDEIKFYIFMNIDYLTVPSTQLVYERNKTKGGLFIKSTRTIKELADMDLKERHVIFLEGYRQTAVTLEDGKVIRRCRLIIVNDESDADIFYRHMETKNNDTNECNESKNQDAKECNELEYDTGINQFYQGVEFSKGERLVFQAYQNHDDTNKLLTSKKELNFLEIWGVHGDGCNLIYGFSGDKKKGTPVDHDTSSNLKADTTNGCAVDIPKGKKRNLVGRFISRTRKSFRRILSCGGTVEE